MAASSIPPKRHAPWRGRPRVKEAKIHPFTIRLTGGQRAELIELAERAGVSRGAFARAVLLGSPPPRASSRPPRDVQELARYLWRNRQDRLERQPARAPCEHHPRLARDRRVTGDKFPPHADARGADAGAWTGAVIIKGGSTSGAGRVAAHVLDGRENEQVEVKELRGVMAGDLHAALREMETAAQCAATRKPLYHASINPRAGEKLTDEQWAVAVDRLEAALGLSGQPRAVVAHVKNGRGHRHVIWSRIDLARGRAISDSFNFRKHEECARDLEREFSFAPVQGAHVERQGKPRPTRTPSHAEMQQSRRTGLSPQEAKATITALWNRTATGKEFAAALNGTGWSLARGDRRDFCLIDPNGEAHSLARRVDGATAKNIRVRMADLDAARLPSVEEARAAMREHQPEEPPRRTAEVVKFPREATRQARQSGRGRPQRPAAGACPVPRTGQGRRPSGRRIRPAPETSAGRNSA